MNRRPTDRDTPANASPAQHQRAVAVDLDGNAPLRLAPPRIAGKYKSAAGMQQTCAIQATNIEGGKVLAKVTGHPENLTKSLENPPAASQQTYTFFQLEPIPTGAPTKPPQ
jgi:hypothetical protein